MVVEIAIQEDEDSTTDIVVVEPTIFLSAIGRSLVNLSGHRWWIVLPFLVLLVLMQPLSLLLPHPLCGSNFQDCF